jgi:hypothetical protein
MHTFLLLSSPEGIAADRIEAIRARSVPRLTFESESELRWSSASGRCVVLGWQSNTHLGGIGEHWKGSPDSLTAFTGWPLPRSSAWAPDRTWAAQLAGMVDPWAPGSARERLHGVHSLVRLDGSGRGLVTSDSVGAGAAYLGRRGALTAVSSRADLVALALADDSAEPARDPEGVGWLPFAHLIVGERTGFVGVETVPPDHWVQIDDGEIALRRWTPGASTDPGPPTDVEWSDSIDRTLGDLEDNVASIAAIDVPERS